MSRMQEGSTEPFWAVSFLNKTSLAGLFITGKSDDKMWVFHPVTPEI